MVNVSFPNAIIDCEIDLAASKSESNRALIINALTKGNSELSNLANARDTATMQRLLKDDPDILDVLDAGTTMRFLTAFSAVKGNPKTMTGSKRMCERPIGILVDALRTLGANIDYLENEGYPPMRINSFTYNNNNKLTIRGDVSSQYISALLMVGSSLPQGLVLELTGKIGSKPYIKMTLSLMEHFGVTANWTDNIITIEPQTYQALDYTIEGDWSGASYWYSIVALSKEAKVQLNGLRKESTQGDSVLSDMMVQLGVQTEFNDKGVLLTKCDHQESFEWDFTHCPDIAQTISVICAAKGVSARLTGLESLRIKETDRIDAIRNELSNFNVIVSIEGDEAIEINEPKMNFDNIIMVKTYHDHRMAMSFAPLGLLTSITIEDESVVNKSYPDFWRDLSSIGFKVD